MFLVYNIYLLIQKSLRVCDKGMIKLINFQEPEAKFQFVNLIYTVQTGKSIKNFQNIFKTSL